MRRNPSDKNDFPLALIVDDDPVMRRLVCLAAQKAGFQTITATDGSEGYESTMTHSPDLILTDFDMPKENGGQCIKRLRASGVQTPAIIVSGNSELTELSVRQFGANGFVPKPFDFSEFIARLVEIRSKI